MPEFAVSSTICQPERLDERFFREAAENGFKAVELPLLPGHFRATTEEIKNAQKLLARYDLQAASVHCDFEILDPPDLETFRRAKEVILGNLDLAADLGATHLVIHSYIFADPDNIMVDENGHLHPGLSLFKGLEDPGSGALARAQDGMAFYAGEARRRGVVIALETDTQKCDRLLDMIATADPAGCGICMDTGHAQINSDAVELTGQLAHRIVCTHMQDNNGKRDLHLPPFKGIIDWESLVAELVRAGYKGRYTFECHGPWADIVAARDKIERIVELTNLSQPPSDS